jgi:uncharacterized protein (TIGR02145 family)
MGNMSGKMKQKKRLNILFSTSILLGMTFFLTFCELIMPNKPPYAEVTSPLGDAIILKTDQTIAINVNAYDIDGEVVEVQFKVASQLLGTAASSPYSFSLNGTVFSPGNYILDIVAIDNDETIYQISKEVIVLGVGIISAGDDITLTNGLVSVELDGQKPEGSTGIWTTVPEGQGTFSDATDPKSLFTGTLCSSYTLKWTVTNGSEITSDEVEVTFNHVPTVANAGEDAQYSDGGISAFLNANIPEQGSGQWSIVSGDGGSFVDSEDPKTEFSGNACEDYVLKWTISTACETNSDEMTIRFDNVEVHADAGPDQLIVDGSVTAQLAGNDPGPFTAEWSIISGNNGVITNPNSPDATFTGQACETYVLQYRITSGCGYSDDQVTISFSQTLTEANAGADMAFFDGRNSAFLDANMPTEGNGIWTIISGTGGVIDDETDNRSNFVGLVCETYVLRWTISTNCESSVDEVMVTFGHTPTEAYAGVDQFISNGALTTQISGNVPSEGTGTWSILAGPGGSFGDASSPTTSFTGQLCGTYILEWKISTDCGESSDQINLVFDQIDIPAYAGQDIGFLDGTTSTILNANDPQTVTGTWSILSGSNGLISDVNDPNATLSGVLGQVYVLQWTISSACGTNKDIVKVAFLTKSSFTDTRDGLEYPTVIIGSQEWMAKNLNAKLVNYTWPYADQEVNRTSYGLLYNFEAALLACPAGWHLPTDNEWRTLEIALGMSNDIAVTYGYRGTTEGSDLKEKGLAHWDSPNSDAVDLIGFKALPGGYRNKDGTYGLLGATGAFWSATQETGGDRAVYRALNKNKQTLGRDWFNKLNAVSVRCIRD